MSPIYKLIVRNQTGGPQNYSFFSSNPAVGGGRSGRVYSNVMRAAPNTPHDGKAVLELPTTYHAICGSYEGKPESGGRVSITKTVPITLGMKNGDDVIKGTTVPLIVTDKAACDFGTSVTPGEGKLGSFAINTATSLGNDFTLQDALESKHFHPRMGLLISNNVQDHLLIGIAYSKDDDLFTAMSTFAPAPNTTYNIQPTSTVYVASGSALKAGQVIENEAQGNTIAVDFSARGTRTVTLVHGPDGRFVFE